jgi:hypothetical protein
MKSLIEGSPVRLREVYGDGSNAFSGAELVLTAGELALGFGTHVFGVMRGELLATFIGALQSRIEDTRGKS